MTFETLITFLTIENNNHNIHSFKFMEELVAWLKGQHTCVFTFSCCLLVFKNCDRWQWWQPGGPLKILNINLKKKTFCSGGNGETAGNLVDGATSALVEQVFNCPSSSQVIMLSWSSWLSGDPAVDRQWGRGEPHHAGLEVDLS